MDAMTANSATGGYLWNGPICPTCNARYLGHHECSVSDILRRVAQLLDALPKPVVTGPVDRTRDCPCRPENGGSGICGCILGGPQITC